MKKQKNKKAGFIVSAELLLITAILVIGLIAGLASVRDAMTAELADTAAAIDAIDHSYTYADIVTTGVPVPAEISGSLFDDTVADLNLGITASNPVPSVTDPTDL